MPDEIVTYQYENEQVQQYMEQQYAEKFAHIEQLETINDIYTIVLIVWGILLLAGMILCAVKLASHIKKLAVESDSELSLTCEKCGVEFELPREYFAEHPLIPQKKLRVRAPGIGLTVRHARKLTCPVCNEESWCLLNQRKNAVNSFEIFAKALHKCIPFIIAEGAIFISGGIVSFILDLIKKAL